MYCRVKRGGHIVREAMAKKGTGMYMGGERDEYLAMMAKLEGE